MAKKVPKIVKQIQEHKRKKIDYDTQNSISFSQFYMYYTCPHQWYLTYVRKLKPYEPSIHTLFGTSMHEVVQSWLTEMYSKTVKKANEMNLTELLDERLRKNFKKEAYLCKSKNFTNAQEMEEFFYQGSDTLDYLQKKRKDYFTYRGNHLAGIEVPLVVPLRENLFFKGYIDVVMYNETLDKFTIYDLKTSTRGWSDYEKKDEIKLAQLRLYKHFFCETFDIDPKKVEVEYLILKRILPLDSEWTAKPIQKFVPTNGKKKVKDAVERLYNFVDDCFNEDGSYKDKNFTKDASPSNCKFCFFKNNSHLCGEGSKF